MKRMIFVMLMMAVGATFASPLFPLFQDHYQLSSLQITILFAVYALFLLPTLLITGSKGESWGLKKVLRLSIILSMISTLTFLIGHHSIWLYAARIVEGVGYGAFTGAASAYLLKLCSARQVSTAVKLSGMTVSIGFGLGPAITGIVIQYIHIQPLRLPFWVLLLMLLSSLIVLETIIDPDRRNRDADDIHKQKATPISLGIPARLRSPFWSMIALSIFTVFTLNGIVLSLIPTFAKTVIHTSNLSVSGFLILLLLGGGGCMQLIPWPAHPVIRMRIGVILIITGSWFVVASGQSASLVLLWSGMFIQALGSGWMFQTSLRLAGQLSKQHERAQVISTTYLAGYAGFIVPTVGVGVLSRFFDLNTSLVILNVLASLLVLYMLLYSITFAKYYAEHERLSQENTDLQSSAQANNA